MKKISFAIVALVAILGFSNCTKNNTTTVNNAFSFGKTVSPNQWAPSQDGSSFEFSVDLSKIIPSGFQYQSDGILVYSSMDGKFYDPVPSSVNIPNFSTYFYVSANIATLVLYPINGGTVTNSSPRPSGNIDFNVVVVQASDLGQISNINTKDYNAVKAAFHLN